MKSYKDAIEVLGSNQSMTESSILKWTGHMIHMGNERIPKQLLYGRLASGRGTKGNHVSYRNQVKRILQAAGIPPVTLQVGRNCNSKAGK